MDGRKDGRLAGWMFSRMDIQQDGHSAAQTFGRNDGRLDEWLDKRLDGHLEGQTVVQMAGQ